MKDRKRPRDPIPEKPEAWWFIATWFGCGMSPYMSGTVGSIGALPFAYVIQATTGNVGLFAAAVISLIVGTWASNKYLAYTGRHDDPSEVVIDEVHGQWLILAFMPLTWHSYLVGLFLFRAFDIVKPWPVCVADRKIHGGFGVMFDDTLAAIYPLIIYVLLRAVLQHFDAQGALNPLLVFIGGGHV